MRILYKVPFRHFAERNLNNNTLTTVCREMARLWPAVTCCSFRERSTFQMEPTSIHSAEFIFKNDVFDSLPWTPTLGWDNKHTHANLVPIQLRLTATWAISHVELSFERFHSVSSSLLHNGLQLDDSDTLLVFTGRISCTHTSHLLLNQVYTMLMWCCWRGR